MDHIFQTGSLFTRDYLTEAVTQTSAYDQVDVERVRSELASLFDAFPASQKPTEAKTEDDLIWKVLAVLGWDYHERQVNLSYRGRDNVPDGILFLDAEAKTQANTHTEKWRQYEHGVVVVESKRFDRPLDRGLRKKDEATAPSTQMLRYLRRVDDLTSGDLRWGFLTNGSVWRLYYQGARSVSEQFFQIDLASVLQVRGDLMDADTSEEAIAERDHWLRVFVLMFQQPSFVPSPTDARTFHIQALEEGKFYEERVAKNLSDVVFQTVFPLLAKAIAEGEPEADLGDVRHAALILLYRLLFLLYAEDRNLLPVRDSRYDDYSLREKVRGDVQRRKDQNDIFSSTQSRYWSIVEDLSRAIDKGDTSIGLPPYNGGLFNAEATPLLTGVRIADDRMADVIDLLSYEHRDGQRRYINYRDLSVQQLGSIYERLLEFEIKRDPEEGLIVRPNLFARKSSGSYYTPDELVGLILRETLEPLITDKLTAFTSKAEELATSTMDEDDRIAILRKLDPAEALLTLRIVDPAMGSGHFLVNLVDFMADKVIETLAEVTSFVDWVEESYTSPLADRIAEIRATIKSNADENNWTVDIEQLDDRHIIRRMVLKRCVYGVDKNAMAVELAKVALWLHTFTVGAPLSFLDHHLRCGDSLFGERVGRVLERLEAGGHAAFIGDEIQKAVGSASAMHTIEGLTDAEIAEAHRSANMFNGILKMTDPLNTFLQTLHAIDWLGLKKEKLERGSAADETDLGSVSAWLDGTYGDPVAIATGKAKLPKKATRFAGILDAARTLITEENFMNWEVAFPGVWHDWDGDRAGGFDAVVGNPPWDVYEFEEVAWFESRSQKVALAGKTERKRLISELRKKSDPLWHEFERARDRVRQGSRLVKAGKGQFGWMTGGKLDLYKLFAERAIQLLKPDGLVGFLIPTGIATDKGTSAFFYDRAVNGCVQTLFDFENRKVFFPDVDARFKFCVFVASSGRQFDTTRSAYFLHNVDELGDPERRFELTADDFARVNPNTKTSPIFRNSRDAELTAQVYARRPILSLHTGKKKNLLWPIAYNQMLNMSTDESLFRTIHQLETTEGAYAVGKNRFRNDKGDWLPLYEGKMAQAFDHRASDVYVNPENVFRQGQQVQVPVSEKADPSRYPATRFYLLENDEWWPNTDKWIIAFKDVTATTNMRTMIAALLPKSGVAHTFPVLALKDDVVDRGATASVILGALNSIPFDYIARQKVPSTHFTWYVLEQIPIIPLDAIKAKRFGQVSAWDMVASIVFELTYTAHDMAPFARDMGYVDDKGDVLPPFPWDEDRRLRLRAKLDAVFFHLYGIFDPANREQSRGDISYIYSTFPIVEKQEMKAHGRYLSRDLAMAYCNTLAAGHPDAEPEV
ncbi:MAG: Eco57I restriction-modification methylase domain-containing protein [Sulfitobacter sp.]